MKENYQTGYPLILTLPNTIQPDETVKIQHLLFPKIQKIRMQY